MPRFPPSRLVRRLPARCHHVLAHLRLRTGIRQPLTNCDLRQSGSSRQQETFSSDANISRKQSPAGGRTMVGLSLVDKLIELWIGVLSPARSLAVSSSSRLSLRLNSGPPLSRELAFWAPNSPRAKRAESRQCGRACASSATWRERILPSSSAGPKGRSIGSPIWHRNSSVSTLQ